MAVDKKKRLLRNEYQNLPVSLERINGASYQEIITM